MPSVTSPLQLTVSASLLQNQGLRPVPTALTLAIAAFNARPVIQKYALALAYYTTQTVFTTNSTTLANLLSIGSTTCPALGNSIPAAPLGTYPYLTNTDGFSNLVDSTATAYLGDGDAGKFCQGFMGVQGYIATTNQYINSSVNANQYLGPMFANMDDLVTANIASTSTDLPNYGIDLANQGNLWNMAKLELYGTPAGLLQQISSLAGLKGRSVPDLQNSMLSLGLTATNISDLITDNRVRLNHPTGLTANEFDKLQQIAFNAMTMITGDALSQILAILGVTTPNIDSLDDLVNPVIMFPLSYASLQTPSPNGPLPIFNSTGSVNSNISPVVDSYLPSDTGCDELGKIIPPAQAVANKAIQVALQQINNVPNTTLPLLANVIVGNDPTPWDPTQEYLPNDVVSVIPPASLTPVPQYYRAKSPGCTPSTFSVPPGTSINDTNFWTLTYLGGVSTMAGLPLIQNQTTPVDSSVTDYIASQATGTGPCGVITTYDVIGLAIDSNNFAEQLNAATAAIVNLGSSLSTLITAYEAIASAVTDNDVQIQIGIANGIIAGLSGPDVTTLNQAWTYMANLMNLSYKYTTDAGIDYFNLQSGGKTSVYAFVQNLPSYALLTANGNAAEFLQNVADTSVLGGQAIVGAMREGRNEERLGLSRLYNANKIPSNPIVDPIPVITPVT